MACNPLELWLALTPGVTETFKRFKGIRVGITARVILDGDDRTVVKGKGSR